MLRYKGILVSSLYPEGIPPEVVILMEAKARCNHWPDSELPCVRCCGAAGMADWDRLMESFRKFKLRYRYRRDIWMIKKPTDPGKPHFMLAADEEFKAEYPVLHEYMTQDQWEDGSKRETTTVLLFTEGHQFKLCLNDRSTGMSAFLTGSSIAELLKAADADLAAERVNWRPARTAGRR